MKKKLPHIDLIFLGLGIEFDEGFWGSRVWVRESSGERVRARK